MSLDKYGCENVDENEIVKLKHEENINNHINTIDEIKCGIQPERLSLNGCASNIHEYVHNEIQSPSTVSRHGSLNGYHSGLSPKWSGISLNSKSLGRNENNSVQFNDENARSPYLIGLYPKRKCSIFSTGNSSDADVISGDTTEKLPNLNLYTNNACEVHRPTLFQLRQDSKSVSTTVNDAPPFACEVVIDNTNIEKSQLSQENKSGIKFGWLIGVFLRCVLNIFGVMLFLRMTWMTGQAGIGFASLIILVSVLVVIFTAMSMSAICTNGEVGAGGAYYMISRSLGPEFGGSIGIVFSLAIAVGVSMNVLGFAETVQDIMWEHGASITNDRVDDVRVFAILGCVVCLIVILTGMEWESKAQILFLILMIVSLVNYFVGSLIPPNDSQKLNGFVGYNVKTFAENFGSHYSLDQNFFSVFAIFFPSYTGMLAGATISGDLKDPSSAIPKGTFWAIFATTMIYLGIVWTSGSCMVLAAVDAATGSDLLILNASDANTTALTTTVDLVQQCWRLNKTCSGGLLNEMDMIGISSIFRPLVIPGIFAATLSSAFGCMVCAPKTFQAIGNDKLFPGVRFFGKRYGTNSEPFRAYVLCFIIATTMVCIGMIEFLTASTLSLSIAMYSIKPLETGTYIPIPVACFGPADTMPGAKPISVPYPRFCKLISKTSAINRHILSFCD